MHTFRISNLKVMTAGQSADSICYVLYPLDSLESWIEEAARKFGVSIAVVTGMNWDDDLTPWPSRGVPEGSPDFKGNAAGFIATLTKEVLPAVEQSLDISEDAERTLAGVSLSGLFALWQWVRFDTFRNIISLSGSFWYDGFIKWLMTQTITAKKGKAYFLLGDRESKTRVKAFRAVQADTEKIVTWLKNKGINGQFDLVPGNHYQYGIERLDHAFAWMFGQDVPPKSS